MREVLKFHNYCITQNDKTGLPIRKNGVENNRVVQSVSYYYFKQFTDFKVLSNYVHFTDLSTVLISQ